MRSFLMLYLIDFENDEDVHPTKTGGRYRRHANVTDRKFRCVEHRPFTLLSSVCWSWRQTLIGWPQSPTPAWLRHQLKKIIRCECFQWLKCTTGGPGTLLLGGGALLQDRGAQNLITVLRLRECEIKKEDYYSNWNCGNV